MSKNRNATKRRVFGFMIGPHPVLSISH